MAEGEAEAVKAAEALVQNVMGGWDGSHDWFHILRVELAALLHDIGDHKYASRVPKECPIVESFLESVQIAAAKKQAVLAIVNNMGFAQELAGQGQSTPEFSVVQDADRLDAIGAIGIGRTFTYGGSRNSVMHDPDLPPRPNLTKQEYVNTKTKQSTINHFHEKLLKLRAMMKTEAGKRRAEGRHKYMEEFLSRFQGEWDGVL